MNTLPPIDSRYMARALELAAHARGYTSPNPMVGAVIECDGRIIGEGYHRRCGGPHAEVWAVRSVSPADRHLLSRSTIYVTLEPCSHYGKTPPCAKMLVEQGIGRVVVGCTDPNPKVSGRGIAMLRDAGIEVITGVMETECLALNRPFIICQTTGRPYVMLKWACSADGYLDVDREISDAPARFSTTLTSQLVHRERTFFDAIAVGSATVLADSPRLTARLFPGRSPRPVVIDRRGRIPAGAPILSDPQTIYLTATDRSDLPATLTTVKVAPDAGPADYLLSLRSLGITSVMVEGGAELLRSFIDSGLWDDARIEISPSPLGPRGRARLAIPAGSVTARQEGPNTILTVSNRP